MSCKSHVRKAKSVSKVQKLNAYSCNREGLRERLPPRYITKNSPLNMLEIKGKLPAYSLHPEDSLTKLAKLAHVNPHIPARSHTLDTCIYFFISPIWQKYFQHWPYFQQIQQVFQVLQGPSKLLCYQLAKEKMQN